MDEAQSQQRNAAQDPIPADSYPQDDSRLDQGQSQAQVEAVRLGIEDQSVMAGASNDSDAEPMAAGDSPNGGDLGVFSEQAKVVGDEAVGGTAPAPDQDIVDDIGESAGVTVAEEQPVAIREEMDSRDRQRWELNPDSKSPSARPYSTETDQ